MDDIQIGTRVKWTEERFTNGAHIEGTVVNIYEDFEFPYEINWDKNEVAQFGPYLHGRDEFEVIQ